MNPCERVESLLSANQDGETSPAEARYVAGHLTACKPCRTAADDLEVLRKRLKLLPQSTVSDGFTSRVLDAALGRKPAGLDEPVTPPLPSYWSKWGVPLQVAAALALAIFLGAQWLATENPDTTLAQTPLKDAIQAAGESTPIMGVTPATTTLAESHPGVEVSIQGQPASIGLANDEFVLEDWALSRPSGGGQPVLTRVGADVSNGKVVVTY